MTRVAKACELCGLPMYRSTEPAHPECVTEEQALSVHYKPGMSEETRAAIRQHARGFRERVAKGAKAVADGHLRSILALTKENLRHYGGHAPNARFTIDVKDCPGGTDAIAELVALGVQLKPFKVRMGFGVEEPVQEPAQPRSLARRGVSIPPQPDGTVRLPTTFWEHRKQFNEAPEAVRINQVWVWVRRDDPKLSQLVEYAETFKGEPKLRTAARRMLDAYRLQVAA